MRELASMPIVLDARRPQPLFRQLADSLIAAIGRNVLRPGDRLPGTRALAAQLDVHRNTVVSAYQDLIAQGWLVGRQASGTFVNLALPLAGVPPVESESPFDGPPAFAVPTVDGSPFSGPHRGLVLAGGLPDPRLLPADLIGRALRRVAGRAGNRLLSYGDAQGLRDLRAQLAKMLNHRRGLVLEPQHLLVTRGSQMALYLIAKALVRPGELVAVEALGYPPAWQAFRAAGARLAPIDVDRHGIDVDALERLVDACRVRAVYLTPHHQYPTTVTLSASRRLRLLALARRAELAIIEDDYDHEFHFEGHPVLPLAHSDRHGSVIYVGTLSKVLAPGLRVGYIAAHRPLIDALVNLRGLVDRQGDLLSEAALAELFEDGTVLRHVRRVRRIYAQRREVLRDAVNQRLAGALGFELPPGGMAVWAPVESAIDPMAWAKAAATRGVIVAPGQLFQIDRQPLPYLRLGFASCNESELRKGVLLLAQALDSLVTVKGLVDQRGKAAGARGPRRGRRAPATNSKRTKR
ncbi:MAG: PLP-dependent aminotransferase family protein [Deltaproteobacteria bacterium]|nr:PLP-dependent aminotransferase family protein [Deltaproteobacteria bacterium]